MSNRVVLYGRVSTEEQVEHGYSLPAQVRKLKEHATAQGWHVVEVIEDDGYSGADPYRPGLRRVLELAESGKVDVVIAAKRDRLFRSRFYRLSFERDLQDFGVRLEALNDTGHKIGDGVLDDFAEWEREEIAGRLHGGIENMVRNGEIKAGPKPPYGFQIDGKKLIVYEPEMKVLRRIFREMAQGTSAGEMIRGLDAEGIPNPTGLMRWNKKSIAHFLHSELYEPRPADEVARMVSPDLAATLDEERLYGLWVWNRRKMTTRKEWDGKEYVARYSTTENPPEQWLRVPVDITEAGLNRGQIELARERSKDRYRKPSKAAGRFWQLRGVARCGECGAVLSPHAVGRERADGSRPKTFYYQCRRRFNTGPKDCDHTRSYPAASLEQLIWEAVYDLISDVDRLRRQHELYMEQRRREMGRHPEKAATALVDQLGKLERRKSGYIDLAADGDMSREDLRHKLAVLERKVADIHEELRRLKNHRHDIEKTERAFKLTMSLLEYGRITYLVATPEDRHRLYSALRLQAEVDQDGTVRLSGIFDADVNLRDVMQDGPDDTSQAVPKVLEGMDVVVSGNTHSRRRLLPGLRVSARARDPAALLWDESGSRWIHRFQPRQTQRLRTEASALR